MTNREAYFSLTKCNDRHLTNTVIKTVLIHLGHYADFYDLLKHFDEPVDDSQLNEIISRIQKGEPYQYVLGEAYFISSNYYVNKDVLIPRQETEQLAIGTLYYISKKFGFGKPLRICDVCTGSGVLGIYLKEQIENADVTVTDISEKALDVAKINAETHHICLHFELGNMLDPLREKGKKFDVLVCNPPYIESKATVDVDTWNYEPHLALLANPKTKYYEEVFVHLDEVMEKECLLAFEIGEDMQSELSALIEQYLPGVLYKFEKDMYGKTRFLYIIRKEEK